MKVIIQRCRSASVTIGGEVHSSIARGLLLLVGIGNNDTKHESDWIATKLLSLKLFPENEGDEWGWKKSVVEAEGQVLSVSQFTLMANTKKSKPDFHGAMPGEKSKEMYEDFLADLCKKYPGADRIKDGKFGAMMDVQLVNDGPATIILDSDEGCPPRPVPKAKPSAEDKAAHKAKLAAKAEVQKARREKLAAEGAAGGAGAEGGAKGATPAEEVAQDGGEQLAGRLEETL